MSSIRKKDTKPEMKVRRFLHAKGFRYRLHVKALPGCPDIVLPRFGTAVVVNGCFWHQHNGCQKARLPQVNKSYWWPKLARNIARDAKTQKELRKTGWKVVVIWEYSLTDDQLLRKFRDLINTKARQKGKRGRR